MTKKRKRRKLEPMVKLLQEGEAMRAAGKAFAEVYQKLEFIESTWQRWTKRLRDLEIKNQKLKEMLAEA